MNSKQDCVLPVTTRIEEVNAAPKQQNKLQRVVEHNRTEYKAAAFLMLRSTLQFVKPEKIGPAFPVRTNRLTPVFHGRGMDDVSFARRFVGHNKRDGLMSLSSLFFRHSNLLFAVRSTAIDQCEATIHSRTFY